VGPSDGAGDGIGLGENVCPVVGLDVNRPVGDKVGRASGDIVGVGLVG